MDSKNGKHLELLSRNTEGRRHLTPDLLTKIVGNTRKSEESITLLSAIPAMF